MLRRVLCCVGFIPAQLLYMNRYCHYILHCNYCTYNMLSANSFSLNVQLCFNQFFPIRIYFLAFPLRFRVAFGRVCIFQWIGRHCWQILPGHYTYFDICRCAHFPAHFLHAVYREILSYWTGFYNMHWTWRAASKMLTFYNLIQLDGHTFCIVWQTKNLKMWKSHSFDDGAVLFAMTIR